MFAKDGKRLWRYSNPTKTTISFYDENKKKNDDRNTGFMTMGKGFSDDHAFQLYRKELSRRIKNQKYGQTVGWTTPNGEVFIEKDYGVPTDYFVSNPSERDKQQMYGHTTKRWTEKRFVFKPKDKPVITKSVYSNEHNDPFFIHNHECPRCYNKKKLTSTTDVHGNKIKLCSSCKKNNEIAKTVYNRRH